MVSHVKDDVTITPGIRIFSQSRINLEETREKENAQSTEF